MRPVIRALASFLALLLSTAVAAETITVFAASSLKDALDAAVAPYRARTHHQVRISYASSGALARQIESGAPAAIFISADAGWADYVESRALAAPGRRVNVAANDLVLIAPARSAITLKITPTFDLAGALGSGRLAIANPQSVPAGKYAQAALSQLGAWGAVERRIAPADNVRAALALVSRGEAPLGIVYRTDALADPSVRIVDVFPAGTHPSIVYPIIVLKGATRAASELAEHLASPATQATWQRFGFRTP